MSENLLEKKVNEEKPKENKDEKKKSENWFSKMFNKEKLEKNGKVAVLMLRDSGLAEPFEVEEKNGEFMVKNQKYYVESDCVYTTKKERIPLFILREWDLIPIGTKKWYDECASDEGMRRNFSRLSKHIIQGIKNAELYRFQDGNQTSFSTKQIILWVIVAFVAGAIIVGYL